MVLPIVVLAAVALGGLAIAAYTMATKPQAVVNAEASSISSKGTPEQIKASQATADSTAVDVLGLVDYSKTGATGGSGKETSQTLEGGVKRTTENPPVQGASTAKGLLGEATTQVQPTSQSGDVAGKTGSTGTANADSSNALSTLTSNLDISGIIKLGIIAVVVILVVREVL